MNQTGYTRINKQVNYYKPNTIIMKLVSMLFSLCFVIAMSSTVQAQHRHEDHGHADKMEKKSTPGTTDFFVVYGNCGMCKKRIEGALSDVEGIQSADWDVDTKVITVNYDAEAISLEEIKKKIAAVGHDTDDVRASDDVYNNLPGCCQYERPEN